MTKQSTTEVVTLPFLPGLDLGAGDPKEAWDSVLRTVADQPGYQKIFWGRQVEHPDIVQLCIDWDSLEAHQTFMASPAYGTFGAAVSKLLAGAPSLYHTTMPSNSPFAGSAAAPATELLLLYFDLSYPQAEFDANWAKFAQLCSEKADGCHGCAGGWSIEEVTHKGLGKEGEEGKGRLFFAAIGWDSVEAHMAFRETPAFNEIIPLVVGGPKAFEVNHVKFQAY